MRRCTALFCAASLLLSPVALADDGVASLGAGGIVMQKTDKVALVAEELYLSTTGIRISYRFRNVSDADYTTVVAFPMPEFSNNGQNGDKSDVMIPDRTSDNFMKFQTLVDGRPVISQIEQRAFLVQYNHDDVEVTDKLKALHIPLVPTVEATEKVVARLTNSQRKSLVDANIFGTNSDVSDYGQDEDYKGQPATLYPLWTIRSKYWRMQTFPKGKDVVVQQSYVPVVGGSVGVALGDDEREIYCTDDAFVAASDTFLKKSFDKQGYMHAYTEYLKYIITSGGTWAGPIGDFKLIVDKGDPDSLVSFCGDGVKKIGPTQFMLEIKNYTPKRDIDVLFLRRTLPEE